LRAVGARIVIIGGGSAYMPGIAFGLVHAHEAFAGATVVLQDIDADALDLQRRLTEGILRSRGAGDVRVEAQADRLRAMEGAEVVLAAFRPGGFTARHLDERIAIDHGIIGQETAGPGGFAMALRSVPIVVEIAEDLQRVGADDAVLLNYTNPVQVVSEAMTRFGPDVNFLGLCDQTAGEEGFIARLLHVDASDVELDTSGTNHMTFTRAVRVAGADVTDELWDVLDGLDVQALATDEERHIVRLFRVLRRIPSEYLQYSFFHDDVLAKQRAAGRTRAEVARWALATGEGSDPTLFGFDFSFSVPEWFARSHGCHSIDNVWALVAERTLDDQAEVEGEAGDVDPVLAVEDALRTFPADEILIGGGASENGSLEASLRRFGLPVTRLSGSLPAPQHQQLRETTHAIVAGQSKATPFVLFASVNLALVALAALIAAIVVLVLWLR